MKDSHNKKGKIHKTEGRTTTGPQTQTDRETTGTKPVTTAERWATSSQNAENCKEISRMDTISPEEDTTKVVTKVTEIPAEAAATNRTTDSNTKEDKSTTSPSNTTQDNVCNGHRNNRCS